MVDLILDKGEWSSPEPEMDLQEALTTSQHRLIQARLDKVPEENIELLTRWRETIKAMLPAPEPEVMDAAPMAAPMPMEQSPLLPNMPQ